MVSQSPNSQSRMIVLTNKKQASPKIRNSKLGNWEFVKPCGELLKRYDSEGDGCRLDWIKKLLLDIPKRLCARI